MSSTSFNLKNDFVRSFDTTPKNKKNVSNQRESIETPIKNKSKITLPFLRQSTIAGNINRTSTKSVDFNHKYLSENNLDLSIKKKLQRKIVVNFDVSKVNMSLLRGLTQKQNLHQGYQLIQNDASQAISSKNESDFIDFQDRGKNENRQKLKILTAQIDQNRKIETPNTKNQEITELSNDELIKESSILVGTKNILKNSLTPKQISKKNLSKNVSFNNLTPITNIYENNDISFKSNLVNEKQRELVNNLST